MGSFASRYPVSMSTQEHDPTCRPDCDLPADAHPKEGNPKLGVLQMISPDEQPAGRSLWVWCPGCKAAHAISVAGVAGDLPSRGPCWDWDGVEEPLTISPSLLVFGTPRCHSFIRNGQWEFLSDSEHALAGQTVPMVPLPDWLVPSPGKG